jgi:hypothetical protein
MSFYSFHVTLHARPADVEVARPCLVSGRELPVLGVSPDGLSHGFPRTFEDVAESFSRFERMYFEPDGSFVWVASAGEPSWQLDGVVYDRDGRVVYVDLKGTCPAARLDQLLAVLGWPAAAVMFQLVREAVVVDEATFREFADVRPA